MEKSNAFFFLAMSIIILVLSLYSLLIFYISFMLKILPNSSEPLGVEVLKSRGFYTDANWYWIGIGGLIGFILLFNFCFTLALTYLKRKSSFT